MVSHRLSQGFQLTSLQSLAEGLSKQLAIQNKQLSSGGGSPSANATVYGRESVLISQNSGTEFSSMTDLNVTIDSVSSLNFNNFKEGWQQYYLSLGDHVHQLGYDTYGKNVKVKRYVRTVKYDTKPVDYTCAIWPLGSDSYQTRTFSLSYPPFSSFNWNYLDLLISGYQEGMTDNLRFWRTRYLLIPMESIPASAVAQLNPSGAELDDLELLVAGMSFFLFRRIPQVYRAV